jgi:hypothetical protein
VRLARWLLLLAVAAGAGGGLLLSVGPRRGPRPYGDRLCEQLYQDYAAAYGAARACRADAECLIDPPPPGALRLCDRSRAQGASRGRIAALEETFAAQGCRLPELRCPAAERSRCSAGRCTAVALPPRP